MRIAIIGGGPAGYVAAIRGAQLGLDIVLIEADRLGGTCLNRGCIPTKTYFATAKFMETLKHAEDIAVVGAAGKVDGKQLFSRKNKVVEALVGGIEQLLLAYDNIDYIKGKAKIIDSKTVEIDGNEIEKVDAIIIATGSEPRMTETKGVDNPGVLTSDDLLDLEDLPVSLIVVGAGVIGLEFASIYSGLGVKVSLLASRVLKDGDKEIGRRLVPLLKKQGVDVYLNIRAQSVESIEDGVKVIAKYKEKEAYEELKAQYVLIASGRGPNIEGLGLDEIGVEYDLSAVKTNDNFETNIPGIYAVGDVNGRSQLAHVASAQGAAVMEMLAGHKVVQELNIYPSCTFTLDEIAQVGLTEEQAKEQGIDYVVSKFSFMANGKALSMNEGDGLVKLIADSSRKLIGAHILGPHASDLIMEPALIISNGGSVDQLLKTIHAHPTLGETVYEAGLGLFGQALHQAPPKKRKRK
ncbi:MAG: dihydrolipoyl dehydrogenase [Tissierellia bacterium]|nr:dihydrolipoyl dehydrogenase [Tissierellia bacterium]